MADRTILIRPATETDLPVLAVIYARCFNGALGDEQWSQEAAQEHLKMWLERRPELFFTAELDGVMAWGAGTGGERR